MLCSTCIDALHVHSTCKARPVRNGRAVHCIAPQGMSWCIARTCAFLVGALHVHCIVRVLNCATVHCIMHIALTGELQCTPPHRDKSQCSIHPCQGQCTPAASKCVVDTVGGYCQKVRVLATTFLGVRQPKFGASEETRKKLKCW